MKAWKLINFLKNDDIKINVFGNTKTQEEIPFGSIKVLLDAGDRTDD